MTALRACFGTHFDDPIGFFQNLCVVIDQNHGIAVRYQIVYHTGQPHNVGGVQSDGRLVQYIENARRAVAHGAGKLHTLTLARGKRRSRTVKRQIAKSQVHQPLCCTEECFTDAFCHRTHFLRQALWYALHPLYQFGQRHRAGFIKRNAAQPGRTCRNGEAGTMAVWADFFFQKFLYALHAALVLDLGKRIFHGVNRIVIGEIKLARLIGVFRFVENMLFLGGTMIDDLFFAFGQVTKRHIGAHAHLPTNIGHQRPHQAIPRSNCTTVNGQRIVRDK